VGADWVDELPVRLAHRVKDLDHLPDKLHEMPSIQKVKNWYAQSFEVRLPLVIATFLTVKELTTFPKPTLSAEVKDLLAKVNGNGNGTNRPPNGEDSAFPATANPSIKNETKKPTQNLRRSQVVGAKYSIFEDNC
jgi:Mitochondrial branched-chain alpha-ketoacid dehydrogenase kinase